MFRLALALLAALVAISMMLALDRTHHGSLRGPSALQVQVLPHLDHLQATLDAGGAEPMQQLFPEGFVFTHALTGLAWVQVGLSHPIDHPIRQRARSNALRALQAVRSPMGTAPFPPQVQPPYGVFHAGWSTQLQVGALLLLPESQRDPAELAKLRHSCDGIADAYDAYSGPWLPSYRGMSWQADNVVAISALARCDVILGGYDETVQRWLGMAKFDADPALGIIGHSLSGGDREPRGTSTALVLHFLHSIDREWAAHHYRVFQSEFLSQRGGLPAVQEYRDGRQTWGDVDSGPLPLGVSVSATVVGAGAARLYGDDPVADAIFAMGEAVAMPTPTWHGRTWAFGVLPIGEAFVVWSQTARPWVRQPAPVDETPLGWWWRLWWELPGWALSLALMGWAYREFASVIGARR